MTRSCKMLNVMYICTASLSTKHMPNQAINRWWCFCSDIPKVYTYRCAPPDEPEDEAPQEVVITTPRTPGTPRSADAPVPPDVPDGSEDWIVQAEAWKLEKIRVNGGSFSSVWHQGGQCWVKDPYKAFYDVLCKRFCIYFVGQSLIIYRKYVAPQHFIEFERGVSTHRFILRDICWTETMSHSNQADMGWPHWTELWFWLAQAEVCWGHGKVTNRGSTRVTIS